MVASRACKSPRRWDPSSRCILSSWERAEARASRRAPRTSSGSALDSSMRKTPGARKRSAALRFVSIPPSPAMRFAAARYCRASPSSKRRRLSVPSAWLSATFAATRPRETDLERRLRASPSSSRRAAGRFTEMSACLRFTPESSTSSLQPLTTASPRPYPVMLRMGRLSGRRASIVDGFADVLERVDEVVEKLDRQHDGLAAASHVFGDFDELSAVVLLQIEEEDLPVRDDFLGVDGTVVALSVRVVSDHSLPPQKAFLRFKSG